MKVIDPGHEYEVQNYDGAGTQRIVFLKRIGLGYPGNTGSPHEGTNCQELLRVLTDRVLYLDNQIQAEYNAEIVKKMEYALHHLRGFAHDMEAVLFEFEWRAAVRHGREHTINPGASQLVTGMRLFEIPPCKICGHIHCDHPKELAI